LWYSCVMKVTTVCVFLMLLLTACGGGGQPIAVTHLTSLSFSSGVFAGETTQVIHDQASWQSLWSQMTQTFLPPPVLPAVDFTKNVVLVAAAGTRSTGGYSVAITGATESSSGVVTVNVLMTSPGSSCVVTQAVTSPVDTATIPIPNGTVGFVIKRQVHNC
jgi:hypothetical protein